MKNQLISHEKNSEIDPIYVLLMVDTNRTGIPCSQATVLSVLQATHSHSQETGHWELDRNGGTRERERERVGRTEIDALLKEERPFSPQVAEDSCAGYFSSHVSSF